jgi:hypothetical protein
MSSPFDTDAMRALRDRLAQPKEEPVTKDEIRKADAVLAKTRRELRAQGIDDMAAARFLLLEGVHILVRHECQGCAHLGFDWLRKVATGAEACVPAPPEGHQH